MSPNQTLLDFLHGLTRDGALRAQFSADPAAAFADHGITATSPQALYEALVLMGDNEDLGRGFDRGADAHLPPPPPPEFFGERDAHGAAIHYLDNYLTSSFDDDRGPFTGSSDRHGIDGSAVEDPFAHQHTEAETGDGFGDGSGEGVSGGERADQNGFAD